MTDSTDVTEFTEIDPDELHLVKRGANGFKALLAKAATEEVEAVKADDTERPPCDACKGNGGLVKDSHASPCPKCRGTGLMPKVGETTKELVDAAKASDGVAASGVPVLPPHDCPTCKGSGVLGTPANPDRPCVDCEGTGRDGRHTGNVQDGFAGARQFGDVRETIDKSETDLYDEDETDVEKAKLNTKQRDALSDSAFALPGRRYPIHDESHARNALARVAQNGTSDEQAKVRAAVKSRYPNIDVEKSESDDVVVKDGMVSGPNPLIGSVSGMPDDSAADPGSPAWEAVDAETAKAAALALMTASELIRQFAQRESIEVAAGEGNDAFDVGAAEMALCDVSRALGTMATMAFHEGLEAAKSTDDPEVAQKAGKRLSTRSVSALAAARDHLNKLLGNDDPAKSNDDDKAGKNASDKFIANANKAIMAKELDDMTGEELIKLLDERDEARRAADQEAKQEVEQEVEQEDAEKGKAATDEVEAVTNAKDVRRRAKAKDPKAEEEDLEDEAEQGDHTSANTSPKGAAKAEADPTPEEIEANETTDRLRKELEVAEEAQKQAAANATLSAKIEEHLAKVVEQNDVLKATVTELQEELENVKKMAAPSTIVRTRPQDAMDKSAEKDELDLHIAHLERVARETADQDIRKASREEAKELRAQLAAL